MQLTAKYPLPSTYVKCKNYNVDARDCRYYPMVVKEAMFRLCENRAYKVLPFNWVGTCMIGTLTHRVSYHCTLQHNYIRNHHPITTKRRSVQDLPGFQGTNQFCQVSRLLFPPLGVADLDCALVNVSQTVEKLANATYHSFATLEIKYKAMSKFVLQTHLGINYLLAVKGRICSLINESCWALVDQGQNIVTDLNQIHQVIDSMHKVSEPPGTI